MILDCIHCGTQNRVPAARVASVARCGSCKAALCPLDRPLSVHSETDFDELIRDAPVAVVYKVADVEEAVTLANDTPFGLGGAVFHTDRAVALDVANRLDTGMVWINEAEGGGPDLPFGGTKRSGVGRELGPYGIDEFVNRKLIHAPAGE